MPKEEIIIPLKWNIPDNIITRFASNIVIQTVEGVFKISFFEANPKIRFGEDLKKIKEVQADCVASIIVTPEKLSNFIDTLQEYLEESKYNA